MLNNKAFRYASLNMAALHAAFGHTDLAIRSLNETVKLSGEAADYTCLQVHLIFIARFPNMHPIIFVCESRNPWPGSATWNRTP